MRLPTLLAALAVAVAPPALASAHDKAAMTQADPSAPALISEGEVRKVDVDARKITLKHGPLVNLDMPAMTMVFQVKDPAMLDKVNAGDKVKFSAEKIGGAFTVTGIEAAK